MQSSIKRLIILLLQSNEKNFRQFLLDERAYYMPFYEKTVRNRDIFHLSDREKETRREIVTKCLDISLKN